jgi:hypothetical protein
MKIKIIVAVAILLFVALIPGCASYLGHEAAEFGIDRSEILAENSDKITGIDVECITREFKKIAGNVPFKEAEEKRLKEKLIEADYKNFEKLLIPQLNEKMHFANSIVSHTLVIEATRVLMGSVAGASVRIVFHVTLVDKSNQKPVWKMGHSILAAGMMAGPLNEKDASKFVDAIKDHLAQDGLLQI